MMTAQIAIIVKGWLGTALWPLGFNQFQTAYSTYG